MAYRQMVDSSLPGRSNYISGNLLEGTNGFLVNAREILADVDFDTFVVTGMSGAMAGTLLSHRLNKNLLVLRKNDDSTHHDTADYFGRLGKKWVFLDDLVSTGDTFRQVYNRMEKMTRQLVTYDTLYVSDPMERPIGNRALLRDENGLWYHKYEAVETEFVGAYLYVSWKNSPPKFRSAVDMHENYIAPWCKD